MNERISALLEKHGCKLIKMVPECGVIWENKKGIIRGDDIAVLSNIPESAWEYWANN